MAEQVQPGSDWSPREVELIVADYFTMLRLELLKQPYSKTDHRRHLMPNLSGRSNGSVEFKHANISAVLVNLGFPYINGYKPRGNYQALLDEHVEAYLAQNQDFFEQLSNAPLLAPVEQPSTASRSIEEVFEQPPERIDTPVERGQPWLSRRGRKIDFVRRDAENRRLGRLGEEFVIGLEKRRLLERGRDDLAGRVEWVSQTRGDGIGFDILSYSEQDESEWLVEVKTTGLGKFFPFYVTANEVRCSEATDQQFRLYRVFDFSTAPKVYVLRGALPYACRLDPVQYRAAI